MTNGWLEEYMPEEMPEGGSTVYSVHRKIGKNVHVSMHIVTQFHINMNGEVTAEVVKVKIGFND